jgi:hypothetical protein
VSYPPAPDEPGPESRYTAPGWPPQPTSPASPQPPVLPGPYQPQPQSPANYYPTQQYAPQPQPYGYAPQYPPQQMVSIQRVVPTSGWATASLVFGLLGLFGGWCLMAVPCVLAVIAGHVGLSHTETGERGGRGQAVAGLILGYLMVIPAAIIFFAVVATPRN